MSLTGMCILLVEDEPLIGLDVAATLTDAGASVEGPCANVCQAMDAIERASDRRWDCAVLDFRLGRETSAPVARRLFESGVPFLLHTGSAAEAQSVADEFHARVLHKPVYGSRLIDALEDIVASV